MKKNIFIISIFILLLINIDIYSCTLWSAIGSSAKDNITLIAKNRDWSPDHKQVLKKVLNKDGLNYFALIVEEGNDPGVKAGINQKNLVVISASAGSIPKNERDKIKNKKNLVRTLLTYYENVPAVINDKKIFETSKPMFYMIADKDYIAYIEVAIDSKYSVKIKNNGILFHTNHYLDEKLNYSNKKIGKSSLIRFNRISLLMNENKQFTFDDFLKISNDKNDGQDNSIWRTGSKPDKERTLASWIVSISKHDNIIVYIKIANPDEEIKEYEFKINKNFWKNE